MSFMMNNINRRPILWRNKLKCMHHLETFINLKVEVIRVMLLIHLTIIRIWELIFARNPLKKEWWNTPLVVAKVRVWNIIWKRWIIIRVSIMAVVWITTVAATMEQVNILQLTLLLIIISLWMQKTPSINSMIINSTIISHTSQEEVVFECYEILR